MTRSTQILRAWISKRRRRGPWWSHVSHRGRVSVLNTNSPHRAAAEEFSLLHLRAILTESPSPAPVTEDHPTLFPNHP